MASNRVELVSFVNKYKNQKKRRLLKNKILISKTKELCLLVAIFQFLLVNNPWPQKLLQPFLETLPTLFMYAMLMYTILGNLSRKKLV